MLFWIGWLCIFIGGTTITSYPPFDISAWLMAFGCGILVQYFDERCKENERED